MEASEATGAASTAPRPSNKWERRRQSIMNPSEEVRIKVSRVLEQFKESNEQVFTFEADLSNRERAIVHRLCKKMGMQSKSSGRGKDRRLSVYKTRKRPGSQKSKENLTIFTFSEDSKVVLQEIFMRYPPGDDMDQNMTGQHDKHSYKSRGLRDDIFCKPSMGKYEILKKVESLASRIEKSQNLRQITEERAKLPIACFQDVITSTIADHQVVLISGETGCGKTTQVPQFLLDHMWSKGEACKIVCTQPRRISATSVAERISSERGESVGDTVGYKIRLESKGGRHSSIVFCTNGVLLRVLVNKGSDEVRRKRSKKLARNQASEISYIIVDEIHERDRYSDFMLAILRDMLPFFPHLRLVLMSATLDAERYSQYFDGCPIIRVPGFTYPVKIFFLEDVLTIVKSNKSNHLSCTSGSSIIEESVLTEEYRVALDEAINLAVSNDELDILRGLISCDGAQKTFNYQHSSTGITPLMVFAGRGSVGDICMLLSFGADCHLQANDGKTALDWAIEGNQEEAAEIIKKHMEKGFSNSEEEQHLLDKYLSTVDPELIDEVLIEQLLRKICTDSRDGAILVFLSGWDDINRIRGNLHASSFFGDSNKFLIISLHSMVPSVEQKKVFKQPPPGCRKIVLSTNIAETAITIDDVVYVIDSGRMKEKSYDPYNNVSTLQSSWISKASAKQREGRAGRCQPGICYHLYSKLRAVSLPDFQVPEIKRMPIEELCLQVKLIDPNCKIEYFLQKTLDPPVYETIRNAIIVLQDIGALSDDERLTALGETLGSLPVHPLISKMLFVAILLDCLDPALTLACASDYRDPFTLPMLPNEKQRAAAAKSELASLYGGCSDQLAVIAAFECWKSAKARGQEAWFCSQYFVSSTTMKMISGMCKQLYSELVRCGLLPADQSRCSSNANDPGILHAVLVAGLYPMVGRLLPPLKGGRRAVVETAGGDKVRLHPQSTNFKLSFKKFDNQPLIAYDEITRGDGCSHIRNCSIIGPLPLLLLSTEIVVAPLNENDEDEEDEDEESDYEDDVDIDEAKIGSHDMSDIKRGKKIMSSPDNTVKVIVDRWLPFESMALDIAQVYCLRERLSAAISFKVMNPGKVLPEILGDSVCAVACILSYDGMVGVSFPYEPIESLTTMVHTAVINQSVSGLKKGADQDSRSYLRWLLHSGHQNFASQHHKAGISTSMPARNRSNP